MYSVPAGYSSSASSSLATYVSSASVSVPAYGTGSAPAYPPKPTRSWSSGNQTQGSGDSYLTQVVTKYTTVCPYATTLTTNGATYTATAGETLTISDCPCDAVTPIASYTPSSTVDVVTSFVTTCPRAGAVTYGPSTYTVTESEVLTVTDCGDAGCTVTKPVPATVVVPSYTKVYPSPSAPTVYTIESSTYSVTAETTLTIVAPTTYATQTSVYTQPEQPTTVTLGSSTYEITSATSITFSEPTQGGYTITTPVESLPQYSAGPVASTPVAPYPGSPSGAPSGSPVGSSGNGTNASPQIPVQTGNGAEKMVAGGVAFAAVVGALFL